ncbi:MAG: RluA family pseudouridine synthase [Dehalococcoidia bacterium]|nr:RluA family pseudouridine synthase [Dehalococcoidia bacterium]
MKTLELTADRAGERLDVFIARRCKELSRSHARRLIDDGLITVNGRPASPSRQVQAGEAVAVTIPPPQNLELAPEDIPLTIIYQDFDLLVVDKPPGLTVHPAPGHPSGTLVNALLAACPDLKGMAGSPGARSGQALRPGIVHRLDKDTSGLMVVARNARALRALQRQLKERQMHKTYLALVHGTPQPREGVVEAPIGRHPRNRKKMAVVADGREAVTRYRVREEFPGYALLEVEPVTGRTHQIRVHLSAMGHAVAGDATYGRRSELVGRQFLHAWKLAFAMPLGGREVEFESPLPPDLQEALARLRRPSAAVR